MKILFALIFILAQQTFAGGGSSIGVANPASVNCIRLKGVLESYTTYAGTDANCVIEQWQLFNEMNKRGLIKMNPNSRYSNVGMPNPAAVNCLNSGGKLRLVNTTHGQSGHCVIPQWSLIKVINIID